MLRRGGIFSICVPDARQYIDAYSNPEKYPDPREICVWEPVFYYNSPIDFLNYIAYLGDGKHRFLFEPANLLKILQDAGFVDVSLREPDPTVDPAHHVNAKYDSIYAQAVK